MGGPYTTKPKVLTTTTQDISSTYQPKYQYEMESQDSEQALQDWPNYIKKNPS